MKTFAERFEIMYAAALGNSAVCTGSATERQINTWFGGRVNITREEIAARQAVDYAYAAIDRLDKIASGRT